MRLRKDLVQVFADGWPFEGVVPCVYCGTPIGAEAPSNAADQGCTNPKGDHMGWFCPFCAGFWVRYVRPRPEGYGMRVWKITKTLCMEGATVV